MINFDEHIFKWVGSTTNNRWVMFLPWVLTVFVLFHGLGRGEVTGFVLRF